MWRWVTVPPTPGDAAIEEVPRDKWVSFLERLRGRCRGWPVTIEELVPGVGAHRETAPHVLEDVSATSTGPDNDAVSILLKGNGGRTSHVSRKARHLRYREAPNGVPGLLEMEAVHGVITRIRFFEPCDPWTR